MLAATVELSTVRKTFGPTVALAGCNLKAYAGEVHAIIGGNGSGKSTLAKVISGVLIPDGGQVSIFGRSAASPAEARALGIANVFQEVLVADECSVLDNLYLGADGLFGSALGREDKIAKASRLMRDLLGFELDLSAAVGELPLSMKQWITIGRALLSDPKVLILDESSAALDFDSTERLFAKMRELKRAGASILIVTHRIAELVRIADRATVLRDGVDVGCLEKQEITESRILALIAGAERDTSRGSQTIPQRLRQTPALRVERARLWSDSGSVDFVLYPGEIVGVTGLDGQGQADFVRCIAGVQSLQAGSIHAISGRTSHAIEDLASARAARVSYVSGDRKKEGIFANLSIFENLLLPVYREYRAGGLLNFVNRTKLDPIFAWEAGKLAVKMGSPANAITSLSGGNQQKVLIARAFAEKPAVLVLNDPARGIDVGAKLDLYRNLREFAARGGAVLFLSSEIEEFLNLCTHVLVFRNGAVSSVFEPPYDGHSLLNAMFGRRPNAELFQERNHEVDALDQIQATPRHRVSLDPVNPRPTPRPIDLSVRPSPLPNSPPFEFASPAIAAGGEIPSRYAEESRISPPLSWAGLPEGTRSLAISVTDPDLPPEFALPRAFAHWLVCNLPPETISLPEGASGGPGMPPEAHELNSDFVTFRIPGFGRGWGGPWPPDRRHRYLFTIHALMAHNLDIPENADLPAFMAAVAPRTIASASFIAHYGPARKPLPT